MKKFILPFLLCAINFHALAQTNTSASSSSEEKICFGLKTGLFLSDYRENKSSDWNEYVGHGGYTNYNITTEGHIKPGAMAGAYIEDNFDSWLALRVEVFCWTASHQIKYTKDVGSYAPTYNHKSTVADFSINSLMIRVPILVRFALGAKTGLHFSTGVFFDLTVASNVNGKLIEHSCNYDPNNPSASDNITNTYHNNNIPPGYYNNSSIGYLGVISYNPRGKLNRFGIELAAGVSTLSIGGQLHNTFYNAGVSYRINGSKKAEPTSDSAYSD